MNNMLSGLIGASIGSIIGILGAYFIYWLGQHRIARRNLLNKLVTLYIDIWNVDSNDWGTTWDKSQEDIRLLYHAYYDQLVFYNNRQLNNAWGDFIGRTYIHEKEWENMTKNKEDIPLKQPIYKYPRGTRIDCINSTRCLMDAIGYNNKMYEVI